jgi:hypothetical protein
MRDIKNRAFIQQKRVDRGILHRATYREPYLHPGTITKEVRLVETPSLAITPFYPYLLVGVRGLCVIQAL